METNNYAKSGKNVEITVKASKSKTTFKTVSKGSKDSKTVKKIRQALKNHGYYLTYMCKIVIIFINYIYFFLGGG